MTYALFRDRAHEGGGKAYRVYREVNISPAGVGHDLAYVGMVRNNGFGLWNPVKGDTTFSPRKTRAEAVRALLS
jgi:hypothetical protein